ncbi:hypothetical protein [Novacetimonas hansenii]|uniref:hypothetical protein n=1 Tax=Novacetimonas hansenii TaxID=436 RepID=UPI0012BAA8AF|nr:hypothetical protein [Novacetimonas hansenii]
MKKGGTQKLFLFFINDLFSNNLFKKSSSETSLLLPGLFQIGKTQSPPTIPNNLWIRSRFAGSNVPCPFQAAPGSHDANAASFPHENIKAAPAQQVRLSMLPH